MKSKNLLILYCVKTQSNLNNFKQQDIKHHAGHSIINLLYLACLCITIYFKQRRRCLIMTVIQIHTIKRFQLCFIGVPSELHNTKLLAFCSSSSLDLVGLHSCSHGILLSRVGLVLLSSSLPSIDILVWTGIHQVPVTNQTCSHSDFLRFYFKCRLIFQNDAFSCNYRTHFDQWDAVVCKTEEDFVSQIYLGSSPSTNGPYL